MTLYLFYNKANRTDYSSFQHHWCSTLANAKELAKEQEWDTFVPVYAATKSTDRNSGYKIVEGEEI